MMKDMSLLFGGEKADKIWRLDLKTKSFKKINTLNIQKAT